MTAPRARSDSPDHPRFIYHNTTSTFLTGIWRRLKIDYVESTTVEINVAVGAALLREHGGERGQTA